MIRIITTEKNQIYQHFQIEGYFTLKNCIILIWILLVRSLKLKHCSLKKLTNNEISYWKNITFWNIIKARIYNLKVQEKKENGDKNLFQIEVWSEHNDFKQAWPENYDQYKSSLIWLLAFD